MTFEQYLKKQNVKLLPWQKKAAEAMLKIMYGQRGAASGKTFLIRKLDDFIGHHGNDFEV